MRQALNELLRDVRHGNGAEDDWEYTETQESIEQSEPIPVGEGWIHVQTQKFGSLYVTTWKRRKRRSGNADQQTKRPEKLA